MNREKRKQRLKILSGIISLIMVGTAMAGCKGNTPKTSVVNTNLESYPIETDETLSWWIPLNGNVSAVSNSMEDTEFAKYLQQATGVDIEFIHPTQGQETEKFNLMIASDEMADMITYNFYNFSGGGASKAIKEQYIVSLNDYMSTYSPNLKKYLDEHEDIDRMVKTDDGDYYVYPFLRGDESLCTYMGMLVRNDWLEELNLEVPETIDEWTNVLRAFKDKKNCTAPLSLTWGASSINTLAGAFHASGDFLIDDDGNVKYGPINDIIVFFGGERTSLLNQPGAFLPIYIISDIWQGMGWGSVVYLSALTAIDLQLYEAAEMDGAGRLAKIFHITLPGIAPTIVMMLILKIGSLLSVGYEKIILLYNPLTYESADVISSFVYRRGLQEMDWSFGTAIGLFNSVINCALLFLSNSISRKFSDSSLW